MKWKHLWMPALLAVFTLHVHSHETTTSTVTAARSYYSSYPTIESILHNPAVYKKQMARDVVRAVGHRQTVQAHFIIHFRKEELHGDWQSFYDNNQRCDSGNFYRNLPTGEWKTWYPNGRLKTIRTYNAEKHQYIRADLQRNHPKEQRYAITRLGSAKAARYFRPQYESGAGINPSRSMLQKIQYNTSGESEAYHPPFATCLHHGAFVNYDEKGAVQDSGYYENGLQHGLWKESVDDGTMQTLGFYRHGVRQGQWKYYDAAGRLVYSELYKANGKRSEWHYFKK